PRYSHSINELAALLHNVELSQNMYYDTNSSLYTEAMDYQESFPPSDFASLYPTQEEWDAHLVDERNVFDAQQVIHTSRWREEIHARDLRRRAEQAAAEE
ncbi:hypothetical protein A2U01_0072150, partial [Trifolium medium]|nr:hypothetical protein [Trifolium medium]